MNCIKVNGLHKDFYSLCKKLETFQYKLMPVLKENGYTLTENLQDINGYILYDNEKPIGSIGIKTINTEVCEVVRVYICEKYRRNGYAIFLFNKIENLAKILGYKKVEMFAWCKAEAALNLYKKLGFTQSEEIISEYYMGLKYVKLFKNL